MKSIVYITNYSEKTNPQSYNNPAGVDNLHVTHKDALAFQIHVTYWAVEVWRVFEISSCSSHQNSFLF